MKGRTKAMRPANVRFVAVIVGLALGLGALPLTAADASQPCCAIINLQAPAR